MCAAKPPVARCAQIGQRGQRRVHRPGCRCESRLYSGGSNNTPVSLGISQTDASLDKVWDKSKNTGFKVAPIFRNRRYTQHGIHTRALELALSLRREVTAMIRQSCVTGIFAARARKLEPDGCARPSARLRSRHHRCNTQLRVRVPLGGASPSARLLSRCHQFMQISAALLKQLVSPRGFCLLDFTLKVNTSRTNFVSCVSDAVLQE